MGTVRERAWVVAGWLAGLAAGFGFGLLWTSWVEWPERVESLGFTASCVLASLFSAEAVRDHQRRRREMTVSRNVTRDG